MKDNEIIKALECHAITGIGTCELCPLFNVEGCASKLAQGSLDLINRQKANAEGLTNAVKYLNEQLSSAKSEAVKEFAERLKDKITMSPHSFISIDKWYIDNLVEEMVGEE